jgi:hypothetical protein
MLPSHVYNTNDDDNNNNKVINYHAQYICDIVCLFVCMFVGCGGNGGVIFISLENPFFGYC